MAGLPPSALRFFGSQPPPPPTKSSSISFNGNKTVASAVANSVFKTLCNLFIGIFQKINDTKADQIFAPMQSRFYFNGSGACVGSRGSKGCAGAMTAGTVTAVAAVGIDALFGGAHGDVADNTPGAGAGGGVSGSPAIASRALRSHNVSSVPVNMAG